MRQGLFAASADDLPAVAGAYGLLVEIDEPVMITLPGKPPVSLKSGRYIYCGSANGPGGLRARVSRHMRRGKTVRWHIDRLTEAGRVLGAWLFPEGSECRLAAALAHLPVPIAGFGSTDCMTCSSHLFELPREARVAFAELARSPKRRDRSRLAADP